VSYNPFGGGVGSIVVTPAKPIVTSRRLGSNGYRLADTLTGRPVRKHTRSRNGKVTSNLREAIYVAPTLSDDEQARLARLLTSDSSHTLNLNVHDK
jgi:hypothetical protein